jgi:hypothetical protein
MATNLGLLILQFLTPDMIGRIAAALGLANHSMQSATTQGWKRKYK